MGNRQRQYAIMKEYVQIRVPIQHNIEQASEKASEKASEEATEIASEKAKKKASEKASENASFDVFCLCELQMDDCFMHGIKFIKTNTRTIRQTIASCIV